MVKRILVVLCLVGVSATALGQRIEIFDDRDTFRNFNRSEGKTPKGIEDYEENTLPPSSVIAIPAPLESGVPNVNFPNGLTGLANMSLTTSTGRPLALLTTGFLGITSDMIGANFFADFTIVSFTDDDKTGVGLDVGNVIGDPTGRIRVFSVGGASLFDGAWPFPGPPGMAFFGIWSSDPIGRIEVEGDNGAGEMTDNIETWIPEPASLSLLALGGLALLRRRS